MSKYDAHVTREGKWWMVHVPAIDDFTQARRLSEAGRMAAEIVALATDVEVEDVEIVLHYDDDVACVPSLDSQLERVMAARLAATEAEARASAETRALAQCLVDANVPMRDVGVMLGLSYQRVHQLVSH